MIVANCGMHCKLGCEQIPEAKTLCRNQWSIWSWIFSGKPICFWCIFHLSRYIIRWFEKLEEADTFAKNFVDPFILQMYANQIGHFLESTFHHHQKAPKKQWNGIVKVQIKEKEVFPYVCRFLSPFLISRDKNVRKQKANIEIYCSTRWLIFGCNWNSKQNYLILALVGHPIFPFLY